MRDSLEVMLQDRMEVVGEVNKWTAVDVGRGRFAFMKSWGRGRMVNDVGEIKRRDEQRCVELRVDSPGIVMEEGVKDRMRNLLMVLFMGMNIWPASSQVSPEFIETWRW
jgi:hypothetical protein